MRQNIAFEEAPFCSVGLSKICPGQGLFALKRFNPNEVVVDYSNTSKLWIVCGFDKIPQEYIDCCWWIGVDKKFCLLASPESLFMRANHSNEPNTLWEVGNGRLIANYTIFPGEEITYNYKLEIAPDYIKNKPPSWILNQSLV